MGIACCRRIELSASPLANHSQSHLIVPCLMAATQRQKLLSQLQLAHAHEADLSIAADEPVSYTHLDVYKRQAAGAANSSNAGNSGNNDTQRVSIGADICAAYKPKRPLR